MHNKFVSEFNSAWFGIGLKQKVFFISKSIWGKNSIKKEKTKNILITLK